MDEVENQTTTPPAEQAAPVEPIQHGQTEAGEEIVSTPIEVEAAPSPKKPKRVAEKFGTRRWWGLFLLGLLSFIAVNVILLAVFGALAFILSEPNLAESGLRFIATSFIMSVPLAILLLIQLAIAVVFLVIKRHPFLVGYLSGFVFSLFLGIIVPIGMLVSCGVS